MGLPDLILVALGGILATAACCVRVRADRRLRHMQEVVEATRRTVLRPLPSRWYGLDHAAVYLPADSAARVGGDFYDIQPSPYGPRLLLGDVVQLIRDATLRHTGGHLADDTTVFAVRYATTAGHAAQRPRPRRAF